MEFELTYTYDPDQGGFVLRQPKGPLSPQAQALYGHLKTWTAPAFLLRRFREPMPREVEE